LNQVEIAHAVGPMQLNLEIVEVFIVFVVPGLVSVSTYGLLMPARRIDWREGLLQGMFYSSINFVVLLPLIQYAASPEIRHDQPYTVWLFALLILIILPASWPVLLRSALYQVNERGEFGDPIADTKGVLLRKDEYSYLELFEVPTT
jgi:hypothetical protein